MPNSVPVTGQSVNFQAGKFEDYKNMEVKDPNTFYVCTDVKRVFLGSTEYTQPIIIDPVSSPPTNDTTLRSIGTLWINIARKEIWAYFDAWVKISSTLPTYCGQFETIDELVSYVGENFAKPGDVYKLNFSLQPDIEPGFVICSGYSEDAVSSGQSISDWLTGSADLHVLIPTTVVPANGQGVLQLNAHTTFYHSVNEGGLSVECANNIPDGWSATVCISDGVAPGAISNNPDSLVTLSNTSINGVALSDLHTLAKSGSTYLMVSKRPGSACLDWYIYVNVLDILPVAEDNRF